MKFKTTAELIDAIRRCAALGMSARETAAQLTKPSRPVTRNAVLGIANRSSIKFHAKVIVRRQGTGAYVRLRQSPKC